LSPACPPFHRFVVILLDKIQPTHPAKVRQQKTGTLKQLANVIPDIFYKAQHGHSRDH